MYLTNCAKCSKAIEVPREKLNRNKKHGWKHYCSSECRNAAKRTSISLTCPICSKVFQRIPNQLARSHSGVAYCSSSCAAIANNTGRIKREKTYCLICKVELKPSGYKFCSRACQDESQYQAYIFDWKSGKTGGLKADGVISGYIRRYIWNKFGGKCVECGWNKINPTTGKSPLEIDHIDRNWQNNAEENLRLLCPNCHSLTPTYKSLNNGNGRSNRYK